MSRVIVAAGVLLALLASAEARPVWRHVPTPLPPEVHYVKVRPANVGPVWRTAPVVATVARATSAQPAPAPLAKVAAPAPAPVAKIETPPAPPPAVVVAAVPPPPPKPVTEVAVVAPPAKPAPAPVVAKPPAAVVVAEKAPDPPGPAPTAAPATAELSSGRTPWFDYISAFVMAIALGGAIFILTRDRKKTA